MYENNIQDLNLSSDEIGELNDAFTDNTFKELLSQYLQEINDPENQRVFKNEIIQLERDRGNDIQIVKPVPGYSLKTSINGNSKVYINICSSENISRVSYESAANNGLKGINVLIPHSLSPVQKIYNKRRTPIRVYSVVYHPETLEQAATKTEMKKVVEETAFSVIEKTFNVILDTINYTVSKKSFKGSLQLTTIRKQKKVDSTKTFLQNDGRVLIEPTYRIKYRNEVDLQNSRMDRYCKMDVLIPTQMIIEIDLPLLKSAKDAKLDVQATSVKLKNENPSYKLNLSLPYEVNAATSKANFDCTRKVLKLELHVQKISMTNGYNNSNKLVTEIDHETEKTAENVNVIDLSKMKPKDEKQSSVNLRYNSDFLKPNIKYKLPPHFANYFRNRFAFTMTVRNVKSDSFEYRILEQGTAFWVKFINLGGGHFPIHFAAYVAFPQSFTNCIRSVEYSINNQNVFVYAWLVSGFVPLEYFVGMDDDTLMKEYLDEPEGVHLEIENNKPDPVEMNINVSKFTDEQVVIDLKVRKNVREGKAETTDTLQETFYVADNLKSNGKEITSSSGNEKRKFPEVDNICEDFKTQFTFDEEINCMSETEIHKSSNSKGKLKTSCSDVENRSWIVDTRNAKKARRKKKARDKKLFKSNENIDFLDPEIRQNSNSISNSEAINIESKYNRYSSMMSRSILKKSRSYSESSCDELGPTEYSCSLSTDDINFSSDSYCHSAAKKTVTFNDVISKKLYSSDISILEQHKRTKRRFQRKERKASDSDNSETEFAATIPQKCESIRIHNENLQSKNSEIQSTSLSESGGDSSDDQNDNPDAETRFLPAVPCSKRNHKRRGKKSARKNASTAKYNFHNDD